ncbi:hypothetical protein [Mycobacterium sp.]|uniref:hypothetical protein n=1 Tax=Mycobacterium sp. TaxID=1785 RepID=UPI002C9D3DC5|nr:hypothetical protein [Mycobacterium sp.]HXB85593.1 hypothetical protein [Mycobacterium sp.]
MRTPAVDGDLAPALTAYATDLTLIGTALRHLEGFNHRGNGTAFTSAVTSHTIWFHRLFRADRWLLLRQHSSGAGARPLLRPRRRSLRGWLAGRVLCARGIAALSRGRRSSRGLTRQKRSHIAHQVAVENLILFG